MTTHLIAEAAVGALALALAAAGIARAISSAKKEPAAAAPAAAAPAAATQLPPPASRPVTVGTIIGGVFAGLWLYTLSAALLYGVFLLLQ